MIRTKHFAVLVGTLPFLSLGVLGYAAYSNTHSSVAFVVPQEALLIDAVKETDTPGVRILQDSTREETREALVAQLQQRSVEVAEVVPEEEVLVPEIEDTQDSSLDVDEPSCEKKFDDSASEWGPVNVTRAYGVRTISSLERDSSGESRHTLLLPDMPSVHQEEPCTPVGLVGITLDGRLLYAGTPALASLEGMVGYALDGFGIFGSLENGAEITSSVLDACHGHAHAIVWNGTPLSMYHYHVTSDAPYTVGCFRGTPLMN